MWSLHNWLVSKLALPDDDEAMVKRKKTLIWFFVTTLILSASALSVVSFTSAKIASFLAAVVNSIALIWLFVYKKPSDTLIELVGYADVIGIILADYNNMGAMLPRLWPLSVVIVDVMLVCRIRSRSSIVVIITLCLWLVISSAEQATRFGLLDVGGADFNGDHEYRRAVCSCSNLPCTRDFSGVSVTLFLMVSIFLLDFYFTRGFADEVLAEKRKLELGVLAARDVASFLAGFKLEEADAHLDLSKEDLPDKLHEALHTILVNLRSYKPYLPQSCLEGDDDGSSDEEESTQSHTQSESQTAYTPTVTSDISRKGFMQHVVAATRATMLVMNMKNSIELAEAEPSEFNRLHAKVVGFALNVVRAQKGMLDLFVGDHVHASFNASRKCTQHAMAAVQTAVLLRQKTMDVNVAVCGGKVLVGDFGNEEVRRFSIIGHAAVLASVYERLGAEWGIGVVCNTAVYADASVTQEMRIVLKAVTFVKHNIEKQTMLWEAVQVPPVLSPSIEQLATTPRSTQLKNGRGFRHRAFSITSRTEPQGQNLDQEWMYALDESRAKYWVKYNEAAKLYLQGGCNTDEIVNQQAALLLVSYTNEPLAVSLADMIAKKTSVERRRQIY